MHFVVVVYSRISHESKVCPLIYNQRNTQHMYNRNIFVDVAVVVVAAAVGVIGARPFIQCDRSQRIGKHPQKIV